MGLLVVFIGDWALGLFVDIIFRPTKCGAEVVVGRNFGGVYIKGEILRIRTSPIICNLSF